ncbi:MAG: hypothetical protein WD058_05120 [Dehalococcoidia bacterium]
MASRHLSLRLHPDALERLDSEGRRSRSTRSDLVKSLIEEGLRMRQHPGIVFRAGPAGRRPALAAGPDVWEVARVFRDPADHDGDAVSRTADLTGLEAGQVRTGMRYYAEYAAEIDEWIGRVDEEAERLEAAWLRERELLHR